MTPLLLSTLKIPLPDLDLLIIIFKILLLVVHLLAPPHGLYLLAHQLQLLIQSVFLIGESLVSSSHFPPKLFQFAQNILGGVLDLNKVLVALIVEFQNISQRLNIVTDISQPLKGRCLLLAYLQLRMLCLGQHFGQFLIERSDGGGKGE